jgi:hypothetical protein
LPYVLLSKPCKFGVLCSSEHYSVRNTNQEVSENTLKQKIRYLGEMIEVKGAKIKQMETEMAAQEIFANPDCDLDSDTNCSEAEAAFKEYESEICDDNNL